MIGTAVDGRRPGVRASMPAAVDRLRDDLRVVLPSWLAARVIVAAAYLVALAVADHWVAGGRPIQLDEGLMAWDGTWYRAIAVNGYLGSPTEALRFFPLYPLLGRWIGVVLFGHVDAALVIVANACSLATAVMMRRLVLHERDDEAMAERAVWLTALFPSAFVLVWAYAEALFLLTAVGTFLAARRGHWGVAAVLGLLAALTRPVGVLLAAPVLIEVVRTWRRDSANDHVGAVTAVLAPFAGLGLYLGWVGRNFDDAILPFRVQSSLRGEVDPITRFIRGLGDMVGDERFHHGLHIPFTILFVVLLVLLFRKWPVSYGVFAALVLFAALSADNLNSLERYGLNAFPLILVLATLTARRTIEQIAMAVCGGGLLALTALAWLGVYVP